MVHLNALPSTITQIHGLFADMDFLFQEVGTEKTWEVHRLWSQSSAQLGQQPLLIDVLQTHAEYYILLYKLESTAFC